MHQRLFWFWLAMFVAIPAHGQPPNQRAVVDEVFARGGWTLTNKAGACAFTEAVAVRLHQIDAQWGHLKKTGAQNQCNGHAVDAVLYRSLGWSVDLIIDSGGPKAKPTWGNDSKARYNPQQWFAPVVPEPPPVVEPPTEPPPVVPPVVEPPPVDVILVRLAALEAQLLQIQEQLKEIRAQQVDDRADVVNWLKAQQANNDGSGRAWWQILLGLGR